MSGVFEIDCEHDIISLDGKDKASILSEMKTLGLATTTPIKHKIVDVEDEHCHSKRLTYVCSSGLNITTKNWLGFGDRTIGILRINYDHLDTSSRYGFAIATKPIQQFERNGHVFYSFQKKQSLLWRIGNCLLTKLTKGRKTLRPDVDVFCVSKLHASLLYKNAEPSG